MFKISLLFLRQCLKNHTVSVFIYGIVLFYIVKKNLSLKGK